MEPPAPPELLRSLRVTLRIQNVYRVFFTWGKKRAVNIKVRFLTKSGREMKGRDCEMSGLGLN